ncbi:type II toxin-antitoxin system HicA family toxin [Helicobacter sp. MIT 11-5569]|uniref:hypothetical protein n=1 Tax=Helicobacter sp. MIT 11-5569 TaxID=1548151 RepID=UPI00051FADF2|nr:hypothetical protein [Helicobacter sp. MIT 11-5569]TLD83970.1 type II toxin-antitoxin system HicA family toxin [Helicobacter sp. MIT 11-5569]
MQDLEKNPNNVRFEVLKNLLEDYGYTSYNKGSSHFQFRKAGCPLITLPFNRPMKPIYVKMVIKAIKESQ